MADVYQQVTDEDTEEVTYELVEADAVLEHIGDDLVRTSALVKDVTVESIKRRKTIKTLKSEIAGLREALDTAQGSDELDDEDDDDDDEEAPVTPDPSEGADLSFASREDLMKYVLTELDGKATREAAERATRAEELDTLVTEHKLSTEDRTILNTASDPKELAEYLGRIRVRFGDVPGGELQPTDDIEAFMGKVNGKLGLTN